MKQINQIFEVRA